MKNKKSNIILFNFISLYLNRKDICFWSWWDINSLQWKSKWCYKNVIRCYKNVIRCYTNDEVLSINGNEVLSLNDDEDFTRVEK